LSDLGYEGGTGYLMFPETTAVFDTGRRSMTFVHGGNSLQERVIPVLTVVHRAAAGGSTLRYEIKAIAKEGVAGMHCLEARIDVIAQQALDFETPKDIEIAVRVPEDEGVQVELCQARGRARLVNGVVTAAVGQEFELFFRLSGSSDARALVELYHPSAVADVVTCVPETRFAVAVNRTASSLVSEAINKSSVSLAWLDQYSEPAVRQVFEHIAIHGTVTESEAAAMLGGPRGLRRFANGFEELARKAPFTVHIEVVGGIKRYVREGRE
jgi:hypothetical protein